MSKRSLTRGDSEDFNAQRSKRLKTGLTLSEDKKSHRPKRDWSTLPDVLLSKICKKAFGDSCQSHATFAMVCPTFYSISKQPNSWSGKLNAIRLTRIELDRPAITLYPSDSLMPLNSVKEPLRQIFSGTQRSKALLVEECEIKDTVGFDEDKENFQKLSSACNYSILQKCTFSEYSFIPNALVQAIRTRSCPLLQDMSISYAGFPEHKQLLRTILPSSLKKLRVMIPSRSPSNSSVRLPRLQELELTGNLDLFGSATQDLIYLPNCPQLRKIKFLGKISWGEGTGRILFESLLHLETVEYYYSGENAMLEMTDIVRFSRASTVSLSLRSIHHDVDDSFMKALFQNSRLKRLTLTNARLPVDCRGFQQNQFSLVELNLVTIIDRVQQIAFPSTLLKLTLDSLHQFEMESFSSLFFKALETCPALTCLHVSHLVFKGSELLVLKHLKELFLDDVIYFVAPEHTRLPESITFLGVIENLDPLKAMIHQRKDSKIGLDKLYLSEASTRSIFEVLATLSFPVQHLEIQNSEFYHFYPIFGTSSLAESSHWRNIQSITWEQDSVKAFQQIYDVLLDLPLSSQLKELYLCNQDPETNKDIQGTRFSVYDGLMRCNASQLQVLHVYDNESSFESSHKDLYPSKNYLEKIQKMRKQKFPLLHDVIWKRFLMGPEKRRDSILPTYFHKRDVP